MADDVGSSTVVARATQRRRVRRGARQLTLQRASLVLALAALLAASSLAQGVHAQDDAVGSGRIDPGASIADVGHAGAPVGVTYEDAGSGSIASHKAVEDVDASGQASESKGTSLSDEKAGSLSFAPISPSQTTPSKTVLDAPSQEKPLLPEEATTPDPVQSLQPLQAMPFDLSQPPTDELDSGSGTLPGELPDLPTDRNCRLLGPFALFVQAIMGVVVVGSLVVKRQHERPMRPWKIWTLDISKQMLGQLFVHIMNVILSSLGSRESVGGNNPCSLYFINIAIDTTVGVLFIYYCMRFLTHYFTDVLGWTGFVSGQYSSTPSVIGRRRRDGPRRMPSQDQSVPSSPHLDMHSSSPLSPGGRGEVPSKTPRPRLSFFFKQLALYLLSLFMMKVMVLLLFAVFPILFKIGRWVLNLFGDDRRAQVFFVMAIFPLLMNTVQFWLIDSVLRHNPNTSRYLSDEDAQIAGARGYSDRPDIESGGSDPTATAEGYDSSKSWWAQAFGFTQDNGTHRGAYQEISTQGPSYHEEGSTSSEDDESSQHTYPPLSSTSSSIAGLEAGHGMRSGSRAMTPSQSMTGSSKSLKLPKLQTSPPVDEDMALEPTHNAGDEADEAWDAWGEEEDEGPSSGSTAVATRRESKSSSPGRMSNTADTTHTVRKKLD